MAQSKGIDFASLPQVPSVPGWTATRGSVASLLSVNGRGLHTGRRSTVRITPAAPNNGVLFHRMNKGKYMASMPADIAHRISQPMCTALQADNGAIVRTVEHLLAAFLACGIDDVDVELEGEELPILDGSALPWIEALNKVGRKDLSIPRSFIEILAPIEWKNGQRHLRVTPTERRAYGVNISMSLRNIGCWTWSEDLTPELLRTQVAAARSYGRVKHAVPAILYGLLKGRPILRGASPRCTAAIWGRDVIGGRRMPDEFVRHRVLDVVGDMALLGAPILGQLIFQSPSHESNFALLKELADRTDRWRMVGVEAQ
jgi:UDP-3-O-[3-hydroxymyristoyl] N-acetylglucosamine deacetylase